MVIFAFGVAKAMVMHFGDAVVAVVAAADVARQNVGGVDAAGVGAMVVHVGGVVAAEGSVIVVHIVDAFVIAAVVIVVVAKVAHFWF
jgi:hypothetical protein